MDAVIKMKIHYLYRHIRLDKNEPFYIGIGSYEQGCKKYKMYERANLKIRRNNIWNSIFEKTKYRVDIVLEVNDLDLINEKEKEFVKLYGRINLGTGILANLTDGGKGIDNSVELKASRERFKKPILQYNLNGDFIKEWSCKKEIQKELDYCEASILACCKNEIKQSYGFQWKWKLNDNFPTIIENIGLRFTPILQYDLDGNFIKEYITLSAASKYTGANISQIHKACKNNHGTAKGYQWRYKKDNNTPEKISKFVKKERPHGKAIIQFTKKGDFIKDWNSSYEINKILGYNKDCIENVCKQKPHNNTYKTFVWKYKDNLK